MQDPSSETLPKVNMVEQEDSSSSGKRTDGENESVLTGSADAAAKAARERAKERARSMHSRLFMKKEKAKTDVPASGVNGTVKSRSAHSKVPFRHLKKRLSEFSLSINSISELEELTFDDSGISGVSSVTHDASWNSNSASDMQVSLPVPQGPSEFNSPNKGGNAPRLPSRGLSIRNLSVSLEHVPTSTPSPGTLSCGSLPAKQHGMRVRSDSVSTTEQSSSSSSTSGVSFYTSSTIETLDKALWEKVNTSTVRGALLQEPDFSPRMPCRTLSKNSVC